MGSEKKHPRNSGNRGAGRSRRGHPVPHVPTAAVVQVGTCINEHWEAIKGVEALFPEQYASLPLDELLSVVEKDLAAVTNAKVTPKERCRLAHFLGHLSGTEKGEQLYSHMSAHRAFFSLVEEFSASYASGNKVQRPCVVGFSMLALTNLLKQEMHRAASQPPPPCMPTADYLLSGLGVPNEAPKRLLCLWTLLKGLSGGERSRSSLRTLAHNLELLSVLQLAHMGSSLGSSMGSSSSSSGAHPPQPTSLLEHCREPSLQHAKLQVAKAACLVLRHCVQGGEVSSGAKALGLLQGGQQDASLFAHGSPAWRLFTNAGGAAALARALPYPGPDTAPPPIPRQAPSSSSSSPSPAPLSVLPLPSSPSSPLVMDSSERLSLLSLLSDLGPDHASLVLPAVPHLLAWAGAEGMHYEHERGFSMMGLGKLLRAGDASDVAFLHQLGFLPTAVRRLQDYLNQCLLHQYLPQPQPLLNHKPTAPALQGQGAPPPPPPPSVCRAVSGRAGELLCVSLEMMLALVALCGDAARELLSHHRNALTCLMTSLLTNVLAPPAASPPPTPLTLEDDEGIMLSRVTHMVAGIWLGLVEAEGTMLRQLRRTPHALGGLKRLVVTVPSGTVVCLLLRLLTLLLLLEPHDDDDKEVVENGALLPRLYVALHHLRGPQGQGGRPTDAPPAAAGAVGMGEEGGLDYCLKHLACAVVMRERRVDLTPVQAAYRSGGPKALARFLDNLDTLATPPPPAASQPAPVEGGESSGGGGSRVAAALNMASSLFSSLRLPSTTATASPKPSTPPSTAAAPPSSFWAPAPPSPSPSAPQPLPAETKAVAACANPNTPSPQPPAVGVGVDVNACLVCGRGPDEGVPLLRCSRCKAVRYCSRECQVSHWKAGHRKACVTAEKQ